MTVMRATGGCACGSVEYVVDGPALFRAHCHCTICQAFNAAEFGDIVVIRSRHVVVTRPDAIAYRYHRNPPLLKRGRCVRCDGVAMERMSVPLMPALTVIPAQTLKDGTGAPDAQFHMFYDRRCRDWADALPKYSGYLPSQAAFSARVLRGLARSASGR